MASFAPEIVAAMIQELESASPQILSFLRDVIGLLAQKGSTSKATITMNDIVNVNMTADGLTRITIDQKYVDKLLSLVKQLDGGNKLDTAHDDETGFLGFSIKLQPSGSASNKVIAHRLLSNMTWNYIPVRVDTTGISIYELKLEYPNTLIVPVIQKTSAASATAVVPMTSEITAFGGDTMMGRFANHIADQVTARIDQRLQDVENAMEGYFTTLADATMKRLDGMEQRISAQVSEFQKRFGDVGQVMARMERMSMGASDDAMKQIFALAKQSFDSDMFKYLPRALAFKKYYDSSKIRFQWNSKEFVVMLVDHDGSDDLYIAVLGEPTGISEYYNPHSTKFRLVTVGGVTFAIESERVVCGDLLSCEPVPVMYGTQPKVVPKATGNSFSVTDENMG